jgi:hypothetical protein
MPAGRAGANCRADRYIRDDHENMNIDIIYSEEKQWN